MSVLQEHKQYCVSNHKSTPLNQSMSSTLRYKYQDALNMGESMSSKTGINPLLLSQLSVLSAYKKNASIMASQVSNSISLTGSTYQPRPRTRSGRSTTLKIIKAPE